MKRSNRRPFLFLLVTLFVTSFSLLWRVWATPTTADSLPSTQMSAETVSRLEQKIQTFPDHAPTYAELGLAYLQRQRETGDASYYELAERALDEGWQREPGSFTLLLGRGILALSRHEFQDAIHWAEQARALNPYSAQAVGILVDAYVELGQYEEALQSLQTMVNLRPDLASYTRVSYLRELHGDTAGAIAAMAQAVEMGAPGSEEKLWSQVQLGNLHFNQGALEQAENVYQEALAARPDYPYALAGLGRVAAARGQYEEALALYQPLVERYPLAELVITLGDLYTVTGHSTQAAHQYDLVRAIQALEKEAGVDVDLEVALFNADHGVTPAETVDLARALYERRPSIYAADTLAWALYQAGQPTEAWHYSQEALRLGTQDALLHYHAGVIAYTLGDIAAARRELEQALAINPHFSLRHAPKVHELLASLDGSS